MVECIRSKLADSSEVAAVDALYGVIWEIERIAVDLDVHAWKEKNSRAQIIDPANQ